MKFSLPLKLGIFVVLLFAAVIGACLLWTPLRVRFHVLKYQSGDAEKIAGGIRGLLSIKRSGVEELEKMLQYDLRNADDRRKVLVVEALLSVGKGGSAMLAKEFGDEEAKFLEEHLTHQEEPVEDNEDSACPFHLAAENGFINALRLMISKGADVNVKDIHGDAPLHYAARHGQNTAAVLLVSKGAKVDARNNFGSTPLHWASYEGYINIAALFLEKGADVNAKASNGFSSLYWAILQDQENTSLFLIERGANVNQKVNSGLSPLHVAAKSGEREIVLRLIEKGAKVDASTEKGLTPMHEAALGGEEEIIRILLEKGADVNALFMGERTPLDVALKHTDDEELAELLRMHGGKTAAELEAEKNNQDGDEK
ncbi:MAG: ankyrin repeat domain-containing protein [Planctomycetota bacterium]|jgi:ankyrin repeat protein